ncbi:autotransporter outer membrane beta-barrel domain-containing protein [Aliiroseovarius sp. S253]|uniref:autotransporter outer membrane beta-barrel domain-containing protein n=1 Tax=Aliiroseovarius sp. S253 TaxID=3415133 RepID=UPI003C7AAD12
MAITRTKEKLDKMGVSGLLKRFQTFAAVVAVGLVGATHAYAHSNRGIANEAASKATLDAGTSMTVSFDYSVYHIGHGPTAAPWEIHLDGTTLLASGSNSASGNATSRYNVSTTVTLPGTLAPGAHQIVITTYASPGGSSATAFLTIDVTEPIDFVGVTTEQVAQFSEARGRMIMQSGPSVHRRVGRLGNSGGAAPAVTRGGSAAEGEGEGGGTFLAASNIIDQTTPYKFWAEASYSDFSAGQMQGDFNIIHLGLDYLVNPDLLVGLGVQFDHAEASGPGGASISGDGYMVGPYMTARIHENLFFDARLAWGEAKNKVSPFGTYTDDVNSERWLATAAIVGEFETGGFTILPEARVSWFEETTDAYQDNGGNRIPAVTTSFGSFEVGPTITRDIALNNGAILTASLGAMSIWTFDVDNGGAAGSLTEGHSGRVEIGLDYDSGSNFLVSGSVFADGGDGWDSLGVSIGLDYTF